MNLLRFALLAGLAAPSVAGGFQDTALLDRAVASFTGHARGEQGGARTAVDARLKLAPCPMVTMAWYGARHEAVEVSCPDPAWHIFVPVALTPQTAANTPLPLAMNAAMQPPVIRRGDPVTVEAGSPGFSITREGIAQGDAAKGARFLVRVEDAKAPIQAVAIETGRATLPGWSD